MKSIATLCAGLVGSLTLAHSASAGEVPTPMDPVCVIPFYGSVSVGYDTSYLFRGGRLGDDAPWAGLDLNYDISDTLSLNFGTWYINPTNNEVVGDELDIYAYGITSLGNWDVAVGGTWFYFAEDGGDEGELNFVATRPIGTLFDFTFDYVYDLTFEGHYFGYYASKTIPLTNCLDLNLDTGISHGDDNYNYIILGGDHMYASAGLTWYMTDAASVNAYVLGNFPYDDLEAAGEDNDVYGGFSVSVDF